MSPAARAIALTLLLGAAPLGAASAAAQEAAMSQAQGTEGHFCKDEGTDRAVLERRNGLFFCAAPGVRFPAARGIAVVGPRRGENKAALVAALERMRPATGFRETAGGVPDVLVVASARPMAADEIRAAVRAQGFTISSGLDILIVSDGEALSCLPDCGMSFGWHVTDGTVHVDARVPSDRLTADEARELAMKALGLGDLLIAPPRHLPDDVVDFEKDPHTVVPARDRP